MQEKIKIQLIMLPQPILVSDEKIDDGDFKYCPLDDVVRIHKQSGQYYDTHEYKIIAGITELPTIDFSALSEEDCKRIGWVDVERFAKEYDKSKCRNFKREHTLKETYEGIEDGISIGFNFSQSLNEKRFSLEDIQKAIEIAYSKALAKPVSGRLSDIPKVQQEIIQSLQQPKTFDVEVQVEWYKDFPKGEGFGGAGTIDFERPKITNNSIKIIKVYGDK